MGRGRSRAPLARRQRVGSADRAEGTAAACCRRGWKPLSSAVQRSVRCSARSWTAIGSRTDCRWIPDGQTAIRSRMDCHQILDRCIAIESQMDSHRILDGQTAITSWTDWHWILDGLPSDPRRMDCHRIPDG